MVFVVSLIFAILCAALTAFIIWAKQRPAAQIRRRINILIEKAEEERARKIAKDKKVEQKIEEVKVSRTFKKSRLYEHFINPFFSTIDSYLQKLAPSQIKLMFEDKIFRAGKAGVWSLPRIISFWAISVLIGTAAGIIITYHVQFHFLQETLIILAGFAWGAILPIVHLNKLIAERQKIIRRSLPEFLDVLYVSVQAGLSFDGAVAKIASRMRGPLIDEFKRMQNDVSLGMTHQHALTQLAKRCDLEEVYLFTASVIQAEKLGTSMGRTLKIQADNMRERHRQYIKAEALRAPIKIIFPMVIFIFPSIFVVVLFPAILSFIKNMNGKL